ncbi:MAG: thymidylate kinase [Candidatus Bathyarchaeia archaeon]
MEEFEITFIVIDGLDASGKTTQAYRLTSFLQRQGKSFCLRIHPSTDNFFGSHARFFLQSNGKGAHFAAALFYMFDVLYSILLFIWRDYNYVIFVRYLLGTAYLPWPLDKIAYHFFALVVPKPNKLFFIDVKPEAAYERIKNRSDISFEMFEKPEALREIRSKGLELALIGKWLIIDGEKPEEDVELTIRGLLGL